MIHRFTIGECFNQIINTPRDQTLAANQTYQGLFCERLSIHTTYSTQKSISIRPGSEPFFLLGMLNLIVNNGWYDKQYVGKYTLDLQTVKQLIAPYTVSRCAELCGVGDADISGITLKWVRSAMGLIHLAPGALRCEHATLGAWAWLTLHALSANALRPGGIYEAMGALDLLPLLVGLRTENAPKTKLGDSLYYLDKTIPPNCCWKWNVGS